MQQASVAFNQKLNIRDFLKSGNAFQPTGEIPIINTDEVRNEEFQLRVLYYHRWKQAEKEIKQLKSDAFVADMCIQNYMDTWKRVTESKPYRLWDWFQRSLHKWKTFYNSAHIKSVRC